MTDKMIYEHHPAANAFPMMSDGRLAELVRDIEENGLLEPITLCDGKILDGRNRYKACIAAKVQPRFREFNGDPWAFAWSLNGQRRDLVEEQRYLIWKFCHENSEQWQLEKKRIADEANRKRSEAAKAQPRSDDGAILAKKHQVQEQNVPRPDVRYSPGKAAKAAASKTNVGAVQRGDQLAKARPDLAEKVRAGEIKPAEAHRQMKKDAVAEKVAELPKDKFRVIYADPPWAYNDKQSGSISESYGAAEKHYPSMSIAELCALPVADLAQNDAVLWLWATSPLLPDALKLATAWGFKYKASFVWDKIKHNMGHYNSVRHELLLICTRGSCTPDVSKLFDSVQSIERTSKHSEKPEEFRKIIDTIYPHGSRIELFRRGSAPDGWTAWGNEADAA